MRRAGRTIAAALATGLLLACAGPALRSPETRAEQLEFERDHDRCKLQAERIVGTPDPFDYRSCMEARGWETPPPSD